MTDHTGSILLTIILVFAVHLSGCNGGESRLVDTSGCREYSAELWAKGDPAMSFGRQPGKVVLKRGETVICEQDFTLNNDGKNMDRSNWSVAWDDEKAVVTINGEEQPDETIVLLYSEE